MNSPRIAREIPLLSAKRHHARGIALIYTLLILSLLMVLSIGMVIALSSQTFISGYYRNFRGSFYAADSGANIARQRFVAEMKALIPTTIAIGTAPLPASALTTATNNVYSAYSGWTSVNLGLAGLSWAGQFKFNVIPTFTQPVNGCTLNYTWTGPAVNPNYNCTFLPIASSVCPSSGTPTNCATLTSFVYNYNYSLDVLGEVRSNENAEVLDSGSVTLTVNIIPPAGTTRNQSFAGWGMFIDQYGLCSGGTLVPGLITGPVFTNGSWNFGTSGTYHFTYAAGQVGAQAGYQFSIGSSPCNPVGGPSASYTSNSTTQTIAPTFDNGFNLGQNTVPLPANSFNQKEAVLDGKGDGSTALTGVNMNSILKTPGGAAYPSSGTPSNNVYLPYTNTTGPSCPSAPCMTGGGIYVEGNADVQLSTSGTSSQVYTITQGSTVTTITVNPTTNTTTVRVGSGSPTVINGVPQNLLGSTPSNATMLYVNGNIGTTNSTGLSGPGQGVAAIQNGSALTITANGSVNVTGDILYATEPVTTTANQVVSGTSPACCNGSPADTLIPGKDNGQVLGIFTATGNVNLRNQQSNGNLQIDASVATISQGGSGGIVNPGNAINTLTIVGGRIQNTIQNINSTTRNVLFDKRFAAGNFAPPWFPSTTITTSAAGVSGTTVTSSIQRLQWLHKSAY